MDANTLEQAKARLRSGYGWLGCQSRMRVIAKLGISLGGPHAKIMDESKWVVDEATRRGQLMEMWSAIGEWDGCFAKFVNPFETKEAPDLGSAPASTMTIREHYIGQIIAGMAAGPFWNDNVQDGENMLEARRSFARAAIATVDTLLEEMERGTSKGRGQERAI